MRESTDCPSPSEFSWKVLLETVMTLMLKVLILMISYLYLEADIETILNWTESSEKDLEIPFKPARVLLQDFTYDNIHDLIF